MMDQMIYLAAERGIADRFHFPGFMRGKQVYECLKDSDVYVMPSVSEPSFENVAAIIFVLPVISIGEEYTEYSPVESTSLSIPTLNKELIKRCLEKHNGNRKLAAKELGISERTLYRKPST